jgi:hypothetical protein
MVAWKKGAVIVLLLSLFATVFSINPVINMLSPENKTYLEKDITLRFEVDEPPIMVGYQLDDERTNWFIVKDGQIATVLERKLLLLPNIFQDDYDALFRLPSPMPFALGLLSISNESGDISASFAIIQESVITSFIHRNSTSAPPFIIGRDLELFDDYIIIPFGIPDSRAVNLAAAKKSDFTDLANETIFEFRMENLSRRPHEVTVFTVDKVGVETQVSLSFEITNNAMIISNTIDMPTAQRLASFLEGIGIQTVISSSKELHEVGVGVNYGFNFILGGPKAYEGVGGIVSAYLSESEKEYLINESGSNGYWIKSPEWANNRTVIIIAGHTRNETALAELAFESKVLDEDGWILEPLP